MIITLQYYEKETWVPFYKTFSGKNAAECMQQYHTFSYHHDLAKYTIARIVNIED